MDVNLFKAAEGNSTFSLKALEKTLMDIKSQSFNYLYKAQKDSAGFKRFDLKMADLKLATTLTKKIAHDPKKYVCFVDHNFVGINRRHTYRRSAFYNKELSIFDMASNSSLFSEIYMVFVDGKFMDTVNLFCDEDRSYFIFDIQGPTNPTGIPQSYFDQLVTANKDVTILVIPNCAYGIYDTNINDLRLNKNNLSLQRFNLANSLDTTPHYITFVNNNHFLFQSVITDTSHSSGMLQFTDNSLNDYTHKLIHLNIFGFRNLLDQVDVPGTTKFFSVPKQDMPIPSENIIFFKVVGGVKSFAHGVTAKFYYPNIYEVLGNTTNDDLSAYIFYFNDTITGPERFNNVFDRYFTDLNIGTNKYIDGTINTLIKNYTPVEYQYDINNYTTSPDYPDDFKYKIDKFKEWIATNADLLRVYLKNQMDRDDSLYIDCSKIDLNSKRRLNNFGEADVNQNKVTFTEPMYLFSLNADFKGKDVFHRIFIDGEQYFPNNQLTNNKYLHYYLPVSKVKTTSFIEIERFDTYSFTTSYTFTTLTDKKQITFKSYKGLNASNISVLNPVTKSYLDMSKFTISVMKDGIEVTLPVGSYRKLDDNFYIVPNDASVVGIPLVIDIKEYCYFSHKDILIPDDVGDVFTFDNNGGINDIAFIRMFRNGRLIPKEYIYYKFVADFSNENFVATTLTKQIGDSFSIDYMPYKYIEVFTAATIPANGIIDLRGKIDKPFDLNWYDVFLNGKKLTPNNVDVITPTIIMIKNVTSLKHFYIYEKNRDPEYFGLGTNRAPMDDVWDNVTEFKTAMTSKQTLLDSEVDVITTELVSIQEMELMHFFRAYIWGLGLINPDLAQITTASRTQFDYILTGKDNFVINPDTDSTQATIRMLVNPDAIQAP